jgi:S-DNA-T family DNA segregation ATPase FtsK/SpoIIIE
MKKPKAENPEQPRAWRLDLAALVLLVAGLLVALSLFTDEPAPGTKTAPATPLAPHRNVLGPGGAWLAQVLTETLGVAVYVLLISWFVLVVLLFLRRGVFTWALRLAGWLLLFPCTAVLADYFGPQVLGGPITGSGGALGAWLRIWLRDALPEPVRYLVLGGCWAVALALTCDVVLAGIIRITWSGFRRSAGWTGTGFARIGRWTLARKQSLALSQSGADDIPIHHHLAVRPLTSDPGERSDEPEPPPGGRGQGEGATCDDERFADYEPPPLSLLDDPQPFPYEEHEQKLRERAALLEKTFADFGLNVRVVGINTGPVITQYEVALETGLRVHKVTRLADDLALNLKVPSVRVVAPIPGKNTVGIEIPNENRAVVRLKEVIQTVGKKIAQAKLPLFLGKDTEGRPLVYDLAEMPHLLIAGRTGTGKSVCLNSIILSMLMTRRPDEVRMVMIDPKMVELIDYGKIPHLMHPIVKDMKKAEAILSWAVDKMEERYDLLSRARVRNIAGYNELGPDEIHRRMGPLEEEERRHVPSRMPHIVVFVDELSDLVMMMKKEVEGHIIRLAQKSRAAGIHLVVATQKPTVDVITGLIKSNLPARICFQVSSRSDSRVVLDEMGADKLLGKGDMLFLQPGTSTLIRAQGTYASDDEINRVVEYLECDPCYVQELVQLKAGGSGNGKGSFLDSLRARDEVYEQAIEVILREGRGSVSLLQRALGIGYGRAARLIDFMAEDGIVGPYNGSNAREVLYTPEQWDKVKQEKTEAVAS